MDINVFMKLKLISWNVNGIRAGLRKGFWDRVNELNADIISIQETKADESIMSSGILDTANYGDMRFHSAQKKGYSGVATIVKSNSAEEYEYQAGIGNTDFDIEGRCIITKYTVDDLDFTLVNGYYPQGGRGPHRIEYKIQFYKEVKELCNKLRKQGEKIILCGDFNTTVADIDLARPGPNRKTTGCLPEEREALDWFLKDGYLDSFRHFYPDKADMYTYWDQITRARERNVGWRIDYFLVDQDLLPILKSAEIHTDTMGSDHCPVSITLEW